MLAFEVLALLHHPHEVRSNVGGPPADEIQESALVPREQGSGGFFVAGPITRHCRHEPAESGARRASSLLPGLPAPSVLNQASQAGGNAGGLPLEPFPMLGKERHFSRDDSQSGPARSR